MRKNVTLPPQVRAFASNLDDRWIDEIAIIGMSCRYPSADSPSEFWDMLCGGKTGVSRISPARLNSAECDKRVKNLGYWGNFLKDVIISGFDNKFFGLSSREAGSMDSQQRLALQVAYEALESAGYYDLAIGLRTLDAIWVFFQSSTRTIWSLKMLLPFPLLVH
jgi:hypothetical protein